VLGGVSGLLTAINSSLGRITIDTDCVPRTASSFQMGTQGFVIFYA
jgi:hypothetical protein